MRCGPGREGEHCGPARRNFQAQVTELISNEADLRLLDDEQLFFAVVSINRLVGQSTSLIRSVARV